MLTYTCMERKKLLTQVKYLFALCFILSLRYIIKEVYSKVAWVSFSTIFSVITLFIWAVRFICFYLYFIFYFAPCYYLIHLLFSLYSNNMGLKLRTTQKDIPQRSITFPFLLPHSQPHSFPFCFHPSLYIASLVSFWFILLVCVFFLLFCCTHQKITYTREEFTHFCMASVFTLEPYLEEFSFFT